MPDHDDRRAPRQRSVGEAIQMDHDRVHARFEVEQPVAGFSHLVPWVVHPFQLKVADRDLQARDVLRREQPIGRRPRPHRRDRGGEAEWGERAGELQRVGPDAAHRVRRHQHARHH